MQCAGQQKTAALAITHLLTGTLAVNVAEDYLLHSHIISLGNLSLGCSVGRWMKITSNSLEKKVECICFYLPSI